MSCAYLAAHPDLMSPIWEAEWYIILYIYIISYNLGLKFQNPGQNFLLSLSSTTDGFTPELKTNEEQKQACCCVDYFLLTSISLLKKILSYIFFNVDQSFSMDTSYSMQDLQLGHANSSLWHAGSSSLTRDGNPAPLHWELRVLATGPPGESQTHCFLTAFPSCLQSFLPLRSLITETCLRASIVARLRSQNALGQNEVMLDSLSPGTPSPICLQHPMLT